MNQEISKSQAETQDNLVKGADVGRDLTFAPVQIGTKIETQIIQGSIREIIQKPLIKKSPYQGLRRFNLKDKARFFGRDKLIARLFDAVNRSNFSLVLGASGSGKSSVIRAGLIPELKKHLVSNKFYDFIFTPNNNPFESLYRCLLNEEKDYVFRESKARIALESQVDTLTKVISELKHDDERWLIFVDQFEELFTSCDDVTQRNNFIDSLVQVANSGDNSVKIILAMRADFLEQLGSYPALGTIANDNNLHLVTDMNPDELRQAIERPAAKHGVVFEEGLVEQIIDEVQGQKGYLPLLQYTLDLLWQTECKIPGLDGRPHIEDHVLNKTSYVYLEGVSGALQKQVNDIYSSLNQEEQSATQRIFVKLVNIVDPESGGKTVSRRANRNEFVCESEKNVLQIFINENLLVSSSEKLTAEKLHISNTLTSKKSATVEIAHEILLDSWDNLKEWIRKEKKAIILKNWLAGETKRWETIRVKDESQAGQELLKGSRLEQIVEFRKQGIFNNLGGLRDEENEFIDTSLAETERLVQEKKARRRRDIRTAWGIAGGSLLAVIISTSLWLKAGSQQKKAEIYLADSLARSSFSLFSEGKELDAFVEAIRAVKLLQKYQENHPKVISALEEALYGVRERNRLQGHNQGVRSVSFSPDSQTIATASDDQTIKLWNVKTGKAIQTFTGHNDKVRSVSFSPDGQTIATASDDQTIKLWNVETGKAIQTFTGHNNNINSVSFSPDGQTIITASDDQTIKIWNVQTGQAIQTFTEHDDKVRSASFSPDGQTIVAASGKTIQFWSPTGVLLKTFTEFSRVVLSVNFSPNGQMLAITSEDGTIQLQDLNGTSLAKLYEGNVIYQVKFSPDGNTLASVGGDTIVKLWNLDGTLRQTFQGHQDGIYDISFSPDGQLLTSASADGTIRVWQPNGMLRQRFYEHRDDVYDAVFSPDRSLIASVGADKVIWLWQRDGKSISSSKILLGHSDLIHGIAFSPDSEILASASWDGSVKLWSRTGELLDTLEGHTGRVYGVAFSADGELLVTTGGDGTIKIWDRDRNLKQTLWGHTDVIHSVKFSPDGQFIVSASHDKTIRIWSRDGRLISICEGHTNWVHAVAFSPDGQTIASASHDRTVRLWNLDGTLRKTLIGHTDKVKGVTFSPDGQIVASSSADQTVRLWRTDGTTIATLRGHGNVVHGLNFSPDGNTLSSASKDNTVILWDVENINDVEKLLAQSCDWLKGYLQNNPDVNEEDQDLCDGI